MSPRHTSLAPTVVRCLLASLAVAVLFAPVITQGWCYDAADRDEESSCGSRQTSVLGIESNIWLWIAATVIAIAVILLLVRRLKTSQENP